MLVIKVNSPKFKFNKISKILELKATSEVNYLEYEIIDNSILKLYEILNKKIVLLNEIGIKNKDLTIWLYYEYDQQCNIEFTANELMLLSDLNLDFCISCWEKKY